MGAFRRRRGSARSRPTVERDPVVVVGLAQNPHVKNVRKALNDAKIAFTYLEYGSYFSEWRKRLAIKMWSGWPTFPQVFVRGALVGGEDLTKAAIADGSPADSVAALPGRARRVGAPSAR